MVSKARYIMTDRMGQTYRDYINFQVFLLPADLF